MNPCAPPPRKCVVTGRRQLERDVERDRKRLGRVSLEPHKPSDCPRQRGDQRPCPFVSCKQHLWGESTAAGGIACYRFPEAPEEIPQSCAIDVAIMGETALADLALLFGIGEYQVGEIVKDAVRAFAAGAPEAFADYEAERLGGQRNNGYLEIGRVPGWMVRADRRMAPPPVPRRKGLVLVMVLANRTIELSEEHIRILWNCSSLDRRVFEVLLLRPEAASLSAFTRVFEAETGKSTKRQDLGMSLERLERAGLISCEWEQHGEVRCLKSISPLVTVVSSDGGKAPPPRARGDS